MTDEQPLAGGNVGSVVRVGDTVRRAAGPWTPAVHDLLRHLEAVGFDPAPRVLGFDDAGRETLTFRPGDTVGDTEPWPAWVWSTDTLIAVGRLLRDYHDAVRDHRPSGPLRWRFGVRELGAGEVICHNDFSAYNLVHDGHRIVGVIDWDLAGPARPEFDLAQAALTVVPITRPVVARSLGAPDDVPGRLRRLCDAYGQPDPAAFLDIVDEHAHRITGTVERLSAAGDAGFVRLVEGGHLARMAADAEWISGQVDVWRRQLASGPA